MKFRLRKGGYDTLNIYILKPTGGTTKGRCHFPEPTLTQELLIRDGCEVAWNALPGRGGPNYGEGDVSFPALSPLYHAKTHRLQSTKSATGSVFCTHSIPIGITTASADAVMLMTDHVATASRTQPTMILSPTRRVSARRLIGVTIRIRIRALRQLWERHSRDWTLFTTIWGMHMSKFTIPLPSKLEPC